MRRVEPRPVDRRGWYLKCIYLFLRLIMIRKSIVFCETIFKCYFLFVCKYFIQPKLNLKVKLRAHFNTATNSHPTLTTKQRLLSSTHFDGPTHTFVNYTPHQKVTFQRL